VKHDLSNRRYVVLSGDMRNHLVDFDDNTFDSCVTDPPYELNFMGRDWDNAGVSFDPETWKHVFRVLKPGAHLLSFGGTRTAHRIWCAIEDAGFEIRDTLMWVYASGFPKSLDVSKAIDKQSGVEREQVPASGGLHKNERLNDDGWKKIGDENATMDSGQAITEEAKEWQGWGTAIKPALEPICLARKPLSEKTVAANVLKWGTGALNIDDCRIGVELMVNQPAGSPGEVMKTGLNPDSEPTISEGRFPANLIHDGSDEVTGLFPVVSSGEPGVIREGINNSAAYGDESRPPGTVMTGFGDSGSADRFFYCAKASKSERGKGNKHPTVKPLSLIQYLVRLVTPPKGKILDPFGGSGTTGIAAINEGFKVVLVELEYPELCESRIKSQSVPQIFT
jgi:DNA modification methylase